MSRGRNTETTNRVHGIAIHGIHPVTARHAQNVTELVTVAAAESPQNNAAVAVGEPGPVATTSRYPIIAPPAQDAMADSARPTC